ncbi:MAG: type I glyceraldehyde-3-phosphate dehydrogenase [Parcubacteria group bacterium]|nr:type I glyceraldehyde-3-phosphate dehydrogenase [Parcubacteria group bacterium]
MRIAINGFGRIGRAFFKLAVSEPQLQIVAINDLGDLDNLVYLLKHDTVYGNYDALINIEHPNKLIINNQEIVFLQEKDPQNLPWKDLNIDVVLEATGVFEDYNLAQAHIKAGAKKVIITAPAKGEENKDGRIVLLNINENEINDFPVISNGSCTTNAVSPVLKVLHEKLGIKKAILNTIHAYTATQNLVDGPVKGKDLLRGRAAAQNIVPSTTGAAKAVTKALKDLENKFDGLAIRVPVVCGSLADITFVSQRETSVEEVNQILTTAAQEEKWANILVVSPEPLVSSDIVKKIHPAIVDLSFTKIVDKDLVKVLVWYDNEWGYAWTLVAQLKKLKF